MIEKIIQVVEFEKKLLETLLQLLKQQQVALVKLQIQNLNEISVNQEEIAKKMRSLELTRLNLLSSMFRISKNEASAITMTELSKAVENSFSQKILDLRDEMKKLTTEANTITITNRVLANRAKSSFANIFSIITHGSNHIYNVKV